jgi:uncharacterized protein YbjT (DUF2867 family)
MGVDRPGNPSVDETFRIYLQAKAAAEEDLRGRDLDWTILRPGGLIDDPASGLVRLESPGIPAGRVPREDVAAVLAGLLDHDNTIGLTLELTKGPTPVEIAITQLSSTRST